MTRSPGPRTKVPWRYSLLGGIVLPTLLLVACEPREEGETREAASPSETVGQLSVESPTNDEPPDADCSTGDDRIQNYSTTAEVSELMQCIRYGHTDRALALIEGGADLTYGTAIGTTAMDWAIQAGDTEVFQALREHGAPLSPGNAPLLYHPVQRSDLTMLRLLLEAGADPNESDFDGQPILSVAAATGDTAVVSLLLEHNADVGVDPRDEFAGGPPLVEAANPATIELLLEAGADINRPEWYHGQTLLWRVVCRGAKYGSEAERLDLVRDIVGWGAEVDSRDAGAFSGAPDDGQTPLICAVRDGDVAMVRLLIDAGADVDARWFGQTLSELARDAGDEAVVEALASR